MIQALLNATVHNIRTDNVTEFINQTLKSYYEEVEISHQTFVARTSQQNGVLKRQNRTLVEAARTIKPDLSYLYVFGALCYPTNDGEDLGFVPNISFSSPYVLPTKNDWEILFQPMFDEYLNPPSCVDIQVPAVIALESTVLTGIPSSTTIDQDAPFTSTSQTTPETSFLVIPIGVKEADHNIKVVYMDNTPYVDFPIPKPSSEESSTQVVILNIVHLINQPPEHINKWTKDHPIDNVIGLQISQSPRGIFLNQSKYALESLKKYGMETCEPADTLMMEKSKLDKDPQGKDVDPTHYCGMIGILMYLTSSRPDLVFAVCMCARSKAQILMNSYWATRSAESMLKSLKRFWISELKYTSMYVDHMSQPWRTLAAIINKYLSRKTTSNDRLRKSRIDIMWGMFYKENVDYPELIWEDLAYQIDHKRERKLRREDYQEYRLAIPDVILNDAIKQSESYQMFIKCSTSQIPPKKIRGKGSQGKKIVDDSRKLLTYLKSLNLNLNLLRERLLVEEWSRRKSQFLLITTLILIQMFYLELGKSISLTEAKKEEATKQSKSMLLMQRL
nr:uncharacterized mitochondrial protein AtMg00810-like [Tanacetum cinerariifolium]